MFYLGERVDKVCDEVEIAAQVVDFEAKINDLAVIRNGLKSDNNIL